MSPRTAGPSLASLFGAALGRIPAPGETIELPLDWAVLGGAAGPEAARIFLDSGKRAWESAKVALTIDFPAPNVEARVPRSRAVCREFAATAGLRHVYDLNLGIGAQVLLEMGVITPGTVVGGCGRCLHLIGAAGSLVLGTEPGILAATLATGRFPTRMPHLVRLEIEGSPGRDVKPFDIGLLAAQSLEAVLADSIVEFGGKTVDSLPMDGRITLVEVGAQALRSGFIPADGETVSFYADRREGGITIAPPSGGPRAPEIDTRTLSLAGSVPMIQGPGPGGPLRPLADLAGKKIHSAFIGSCAAGRKADLMEAAAVVKRARRIHADVRLTLAPATLEVARYAVTAGLYEIFINAGAMLAVPGSSPGMASGGAAFGEGEVILSTVPYNSPLTDAGRGPEVFRASPLVVATAAVTGRIPEPSEL